MSEAQLKESSIARECCTIGELAEAGPERLGKWLGKWGYTLYAFAHGDDLSPVARAGSERVIKSIGNSITAPRDILNMDEAKTVFFSLSESVAARLREHALKGEKVQISLRRNDLGRIERQMKLAQPTSLSMRNMRRSHGSARPEL